MRELLLVLCRKSFVIFITLALLAPSALKLAHAFNHHEHIVCEGDNSTHFHTKDLDCDFYKYKLSKELQWTTTVSYDQFNTTNSKQYIDFLVKADTNIFFYFSLRAPPSSELV